MANATSRYAVPVVATENLLAASPNFRAGAGASDYDSAKKFIFYQEAIDEADPTAEAGQVLDRRPRAIIHFEDYARTEDGPGNWVGDFKACIVLEFVPPPDVWGGPGQPHNRKAEFIWAANLFGAIEDDLEKNSGGFNANGDAYLAVKGIADIVGPVRVDAREESQYFWVMEWMLTAS